MLVYQRRDPRKDPRVGEGKGHPGSGEKADEECAHGLVVAMGNWDPFLPGTLCGLAGFELQPAGDSTCAAKPSGLILSLRPWASRAALVAHYRA